MACRSKTLVVRGGIVWQLQDLRQGAGGEILPAVRDGGRIVCLRAFVGELDRGISTELISVRAYTTESEKLRSLAGLVEQGALNLRVAEIFSPDRAADAHA